LIEERREKPVYDESILINEKEIQRRLIFLADRTLKIYKDVKRR
jgi:hypothetical protein